MHTKQLRVNLITKWCPYNYLTSLGKDSHFIFR